MNKKLLSILSVLVMATAAQAGWMLEPQIGYEMGTFTVTTVPPVTTSTGTTSGILAGAKFGYMTGSKWWFGLDAQIGTGGKAKYDLAGISDDDVSKTMAFLDVGYDVNWFRVYAGYAPLYNMTKKTSTSETVYTGSGVKLGLAAKVAPKVMLNFEYHMPTFSKQSVDGATATDVSTAYSKFEFPFYSFSVSFPFML